MITGVSHVIICSPPSFVHTHSVLHFVPISCTHKKGTIKEVTGEFNGRSGRGPRRVITERSIVTRFLSFHPRDVVVPCVHVPSYGTSLTGRPNEREETMEGSVLLRRVRSVLRVTVIENKMKMSRPP